MRPEESAVDVVLNTAFKKHSQHRIVLAHHIQLGLMPSVFLDYCKMLQVKMLHPMGAEPDQILSDHLLTIISQKPAELGVEIETTTEYVNDNETRMLLN